MHQRIFKKWKEHHAKFSISEAEKTVSNAPRSESPNDLLYWAKNHFFLKTKKTPVPEGIFPMELGTATLIDVSIRPPNCKRLKIGDDDVYDAFPVLRKYVPRGLCFFEFVKEDPAAATTTTSSSSSATTTHAATAAASAASSTEEAAAAATKSEEVPKKNKKDRTVYTIVYAMKKFTGGPGDDDDLVDEMEAAAKTEGQAPVEEGEATSTGNSSSSSTALPAEAKTRWEQYFVDSVKKTSKVIVSSKENGESAHLSQFRLPGNSSDIYYVAGSKTTHVLFRNQADIDKYTHAQFRVAKGIASALLSLLETLDQHKVRQFFDYMHQHQVNATFEYLDVTHQHVELFNFETNQFRFITFTNLAVDLGQSLCADNMLQSIAVAKEAGLTTVDATEFTYHDIDKAFDVCRAMYGKEGAVVYYLNADNKVIGLVKKKSTWYIMARAIREKMKHFVKRVEDKKEGFDLEKEVKNAKYRMKQTIHQKQKWLGLSEEITTKWVDLSLLLVDYLSTNVPAKVTTVTVHNVFPKVWNAFLTEVKQIDNF